MGTIGDFRDPTQWQLTHLVRPSDDDIRRLYGDDYFAERFWISGMWGFEIGDIIGRCWKANDIFFMRDFDKWIRENYNGFVHEETQLRWKIFFPTNEAKIAFELAWIY